MKSDYYQKFIKEAFIDSIRSVLIIDDDYPTFYEVLSNQHELNNGEEIDKGKAWYGNPERIRDVIRKFRDNNPPLLVDIHDGRNIDAETEKTVAKHLHQSDLLVLDYQLDKTGSEDGALAIEILRKLMSNDHFNLVIVYTSQYLDTVFDEVRLGLLSPYFKTYAKEDEKVATDIIDNAEDVIEKFYEKINDSIGKEQYFHSRLHTSSYLRVMAMGKQPYSDFFALCSEAGLLIEQSKIVLRYILREFEKSQLSFMNIETPEDELKWSTKSPRWIKGNSIFVGFSNKSDDDDLLSELQNSLNDWKPNPSRLFHAKLRASIDEYGVVAQTQALTNKHALAYWYRRLLQANDLERRWYVDESVSRHSDRLMNAILPRVRTFANDLIETEAPQGKAAQKCEEHFNIDLTKDVNEKKAVREHNAYVCSRNPEGWHLTTGHIFTMHEDEHWLCLSPACDMVPSQVSKWQEDMFGKRLPFSAVRLHSIKEKWPKDIHTNRYLFFQVSNEVQVFCFNDPSKDSSVPHWNTFYAENAGIFSSEDFQFEVWRTEMEHDDVQEGNEDKINLVLKRRMAKVVSQLRYEYALNLLQKLGVSLTRVGLDFSDWRPQP